MLIKFEKSLFFQWLFIRLKKLIFIICSIVSEQNIGERILLLFKNIHENIYNEIN